MSNPIADFRSVISSVLCLWTVAFSPAYCQSQASHYIPRISLNDYLERAMTGDNGESKKSKHYSARDANVTRAMIYGLDRAIGGAEADIERLGIRGQQSATDRSTVTRQAESMQIDRKDRFKKELIARYTLARDQIATLDRRLSDNLGSMTAPMYSNFNPESAQYKSEVRAITTESTDQIDRIWDNLVRDERLLEEAYVKDLARITASGANLQERIKRQHGASQVTSRGTDMRTQTYINFGGDD